MKNNKFVKRILSSLIALTMIFTLIPAAFVSAAETDAPEGMYWDMVTINMDAFDGLRESAGTDTATVNGREYTLTYETPNGKVHPNSHIYKYAEIPYTLGGTKPEAVGEYVYNWRYGYHSSIGGSAFPSSGLRLKNIYDINEVQEGDKILIKAHVQPRADTIYSWTTAQGTIGTDGVDQTKVNMTIAAGDQSANPTLIPGQWNEMILEYELTSANIESNSVKINVGSDDSTPIPLEWALGSIEIGILKPITEDVTEVEWEEPIASINMDGFAGMTSPGSAESTIDGRTYRVAYETENGAVHGNSHAFKYTENAFALSGTKPASVGNYVLNYRYGWTGSANSMPSGGWRVSNIYDPSDVKVGDKLIIRAQVQPQNAVYLWQNGTQDITGEKPTETQLTISAGGVTQASNYKVGQWNRMVLEYELTDANIASNSVKIYSGVSNGENVSLQWALGSVEVGIIKTARKDGATWETLASIDMDGFTQLSTDTTVETKTVDERTVYVVADSAGGAYKGYGYIPTTTNDTTYGNVGADLPGIAGNMIWYINRSWSNGWPKSSSGARIKNIFDKSRINEGDRIKITAWVYTSYKYDSTTDEAVSDYTGDYDIRMWLSQPDEEITGNVKHNDSAPHADYTDEYTWTTIKEKTWTPITIEYTASSYTKDVTSIRIDNCCQEGNTVWPLRMLLAGVKAEKLVQPNGTYTITDGTVSGAFTAAFGAGATGSQMQIIVAAYAGDTFLGCDFVDFVAGSQSYNFEIANAASATKVVAYVWDMTDIEPQRAPIVLTLAE